ncbi:MAG TPA: flagellar hook-length control protein FliK [Acidiferrobacterales bacterium]|nr:flagellar hook-length control protein FliK [Acidiferrobacterales bacterium]
MPQSIQVLPPVARAIPAAGAPGGSAEAPDSGQSFESALASHRATGEAPAGDVRTEKGAKPDAPLEADAPVAAELAASGNLLPLALPPVPVDPAAGAEAAGLLAGETATPAGTVAGDLQDFSATPESIVDVLAAVPGIPISIMTTSAMAPPGQPPVVLPATEGRSFFASVESSLNHPVVANMVTHTTAVDAQTLAALAAEAATTAPSVKTPDMAASLEGFRVALKEIAPATADARPLLTSSMFTSGTLTASSFTNALASAPAGAPVPGASITVPFGQAGWGQAFGNQVVWAVNQGMPAAELHLSPPDLGPMSVRISMDQDQASIAFSSSHAMVREAIEAALPRLRDMLGSQGITLADVNVSQHHSSQAQRDPGGSGHAAISGRATDGEIEAAAQMTQGRSIGVLDLYA